MMVFVVEYRTPRNLVCRVVERELTADAPLSFGRSDGVLQDSSHPGSDDDDIVLPMDCGSDVSSDADSYARDRSHIRWRHFTIEWTGRILQVLQRMDPPRPKHLIYHRGAAVAELFAVAPGERFQLDAFEFYVEEFDDGSEPKAPVNPEVIHAPIPPVDPRVERLLRVIEDCSHVGEAAFDGVFVRSVSRHYPDFIRAAALLDYGGGSPPTPRALVPDDFQPSGTVLRELERQGDLVSRTRKHLAAGTLTRIADWQVAIPIRLSDGLRRRAFYLAGASDQDTEKDLERAATLLAVLAKIYSVLRERQIAAQSVDLLKQFLPDHARRLTTRTDFHQVLTIPRMGTATVIFCDLRNSSDLFRLADSGESGTLIDHALTAMSGPVVESRGIVSEFLGDAVLGFWGWPDADAGQARRAVEAALNIERRFRQLRQQHAGTPLANLQFGIGLAHGTARMGRLGSFDLFKLGIFGVPPVRANRIEAVSKAFHRSDWPSSHVLLEQAVRDAADIPRDDARCRLRRLGRFRLRGLGETLTLFEAVDREFGSGFERYEDGLEAFERGDWTVARNHLKFCEPSDNPADFLRRRIDVMENAIKPSQDEEGMVIDLTS